MTAIAAAVSKKPLVRVDMKYNNGLPAAMGAKTLPASWTARAAKNTLPEEFQTLSEPFEASGFTRSQALLGLERILKSYGIEYILDIKG